MTHRLLRTETRYGTRNLPALLALGDALDFQAAIGLRAKDARYRHFFERLREHTEATPGLSWSSPERWEMAACLTAISLAGLPSTDFSTGMLEHGFVFRPFRTQALNSVRIAQLDDLGGGAGDVFQNGAARPGRVLTRTTR